MLASSDSRLRVVNAVLQGPAEHRSKAEGRK
jgi:hypothetical protein